MTAEPSSPRGRPSRGVDRARIIAGVASAVQGVLLLGFCAFSVYELVQGGSDDATRAVMEVVLVAVFAAGLLAMARYWWAGANWPNTPTIVWNALLLPVAWGVGQGGQWLVALGVALVAVTGIVSAVAADTSTQTGSRG